MADTEHGGREGHLPDGIARLYCVQNVNAIQTYSLRWQYACRLPAVTSPRSNQGQQHRMRSAQRLLKHWGRGATAFGARPGRQRGRERAEQAGERRQRRRAGEARAGLGVLKPPPPITTPPVAAGPQPRPPTSKQLKQLAGSSTAALGPAASAEGRPSGQLGGRQLYGEQRAPTPPAKPPSPALSAALPPFPRGRPAAQAATPDASRVPMLLGGP